VQRGLDPCWWWSLSLFSLRVVLGYDLKNLLLVGPFALLLFGPDGRPVPAPQESAITC